MATIGVESTLSDIERELVNMGHNIVHLHSLDDAKQCDCCVISGQDKDFLGIQNAIIAGSVINARGFTSNDVCQMVEEKVF